MEWKDEYSVQVPEIDREHRILLDYVTGVEDAFQSGSPPVLDAIGRLLSFAVTHFTFEETVMRIQGYRDLDAHFTGHQQFLDKLRALEEQAREQRLPADAPSMLRSWMERHFLADDRYYAASLSPKQRDLIRKYCPS